MKLYRIIAKFEPGHPSLRGSRTTRGKRGQKEIVRRGVWRVIESFPFAKGKDIFVFECPYHGHEVYTLSPHLFKRGVLCNPFRMLKEVLAAKGRA